MATRRSCAGGSMATRSRSAVQCGCCRRTQGGWARTAVPATLAPGSAASSTQPQVVIVNASKYDRGCSWSALGKVAQVHRYDDSKREEILQRIEGASVIVTKELPVPADLINAFPASVKGICEAGTGYNNIDLEAATARGMTVCNVPAYSTKAVAALVMTYVLNFSCSMFEHKRRYFKGDRESFTTGMEGGGGTVSYELPHMELDDKIIGLICGGGRIGLAVADMALAFDMRVLVSGRSKPKRADLEFVKTEELLQRSDFVSVHCPLFPETKHLIDSKMIQKMKSSAYLINCARGAVVKEVDLIAELHKGTIAGAALDVQEQEPLPMDSPLFTTPNLYLSPHIGWQRLESRQKLVDTTIANVAAIIQGTPIHVVN